jgi:hypothetical protein
VAGARQPGPFDAPAAGLDGGTLGRFPQAGPGPTGYCVDQVGHWNMTQRLLTAAEYGVRGLPDDLRQELMVLFTPANVAITGVVMAAWAVSHAYGAGEVVDVGLLLFALCVVGHQATDGVRQLARFVRLAVEAHCDGDLHLAGHAFSIAATELGAATLTALILKRGMMSAAARPAAAGLSAGELDALVDRMLVRRFGSTQNVGTLVRENVVTVARFHRERGLSEEKMLEVLKGIDLHAVKPVEVVEFQRGQLLAQFYDQRVGQWFTAARQGATESDVGIAKASRVRKLFRLTANVKMLKSRSASVVDTWTQGREGEVFAPNPATTRPISNAPLLSEPAPKMKAGEYTRGGGEQFFLPLVPGESPLNYMQPAQ